MINDGSAITNILVTGPPGCGKSTLVMRVLARISATAGGFTTAEMRTPGGPREGFRITGLSGAEGVLAHVMFKAGPRVGRYRVNLDDLERIGVAELERAVNDVSTSLIVVDEIAKMELFSESFRRVVARALESSKPLIGTIQIRRDPFLDRIRARVDTEIISIDRRTPDDAEARIVSHLSRILDPDNV
jgi:nucleoside-triphosphatase